MSVWRFAELLPEVSAAHRVTLGEGDTPLVRSHRIGPALGLHHLYFKLESLNPSGSYKDRFAAVAVSVMLDEGKARCVGTSSGNSGAALAAYCAAAGVRCQIAVVEPAPHSKLLQMLAHKAELRRIRGFGIDEEITQRVFEKLAAQGRAADAALQISAYRYSPIGMSGVQTISYELAEHSRRVQEPIDHVFVPAGGGGLALAVACGAIEANLPAAVHVAQPAGNDTIATPLRNGAQEAVAVRCTTTISGLQVPTVIDGTEALRACRSTGGNGHVVTDEEVAQAQARMAHEEGILCEPAGAVALAAVANAVARRELAAEHRVVCIVTGSGFKHIASLEQIAREQVCPLVEVGELTS